MSNQGTYAAVSHKSFEKGFHVFRTTSLARAYQWFQDATWNGEECAVFKMEPRPNSQSVWVLEPVFQKDGQQCVSYWRRRHTRLTVENSTGLTFDLACMGKREVGSCADCLRFYECYQTKGKQANRLTYREGKGYKTVAKSASEIIDKLGRYEDSGIQPEEIMEALADASCKGRPILVRLEKGSREVMVRPRDIAEFIGAPEELVKAMLEAFNLNPNDVVRDSKEFRKFITKKAKEGKASLSNWKQES